VAVAIVEGAVAVGGTGVAGAAGAVAAGAGAGAGAGRAACACAVPAVNADAPTKTAKHPHAATVRIALSFLSKFAARSLVQAGYRVIRYDRSVELQSADAVWARIEALAAERPGGVVATDGDGTLWSGDVGEDLFHAFLDHGRTEPAAYEAICQQARDHGESDAGTGADVARRIYAAYLAGRYPEERMCELMAWCFAGWARAEVSAFARDVIDKGGLAQRLHPEVLGLLGRARAAGLPVVLVSASPIAVIEEAGSRVGFGTGSIVAARPVFQGDAMLPAVERPIPYGPGKVAGLRARIGADTPLYAAFGDNAFDVHLLASAAVPVAVRPKPRLRARAGDVPGLVEIAQSR
jgi:phosphatidylglycerophosphatase C